MQPRVVDAFDAVVEHVSNRVGEIDDRDPIDPEEYWLNVLSRGKGCVKPVGDETYVYADDKNTIWNEYQGFGRSFGVDASTTRDISFENGLILDVANAVFGEKNTDRQVRNHRTIVAGAWFDDGEEKFERVTIQDESWDTDYGEVDTYAEAAFLPSTRGYLQAPNKWVSAGTQALAEGRHLKTYVDELDAPVFLDGALYPMSVLSRLLFVTLEGAIVSPEWREATKAMVQLYVDGIEQQLASGHPVIAVTKSVNTNEVLKAIEANQEDGPEQNRVPWTDDYAYATSLLAQPRHDNQTYSYTSWVVQEKVSIKSERVELVGEFEFSEFSAPDLRRAFFFARVPREGHIFRIEVPAMYVQNMDLEGRRMFQRAILREIVETEDTPRAVLDADHHAQITLDVRDRISENMKSQTVSDYNRARWEHLAYQGGGDW
ncbi:DNA double-strand break repair nuclease NurA [Halobacteria archaeon AArc-curdl1]|uniref:DNA double-strand break repair nuclease NurA n=1 Tax=Natronosalvus hydrolyticus TaxID=2979988 RepID=A0AAP3E6G4_9EURY|nr:DNA double-strand break repair nuclease NurA [Halobacteria archaeon AArc-curdl1]